MFQGDYMKELLRSDLPQKDVIDLHACQGRYDVKGHRGTIIIHNLRGNLSADFSCQVIILPPTSLRTNDLIFSSRTKVYFDIDYDCHVCLFVCLTFFFHISDSIGRTISISVDLAERAW